MNPSPRERREGTEQGSPRRDGGPTKAEARELLESGIAAAAVASVSRGDGRPPGQRPSKRLRRKRTPLLLHRNLPWFAHSTHNCTIPAQQPACRGGGKPVAFLWSAAGFFFGGLKSASSPLG